MERVIGRCDTGTKGILVICTGGIHGDELAGVKALEIVFELLKSALNSQSFKFKGRLLGLRGNISAIQINKRFVEKDLNRQWQPDNVKRILQAVLSSLDIEDRELRLLMETIQEEINVYKPKKVVLLDLHTTQSLGGFFSLVTNDAESLKLGMELQAPVVQGIAKGLKRTLFNYFNQDNLGVPSFAVCFESGQHTETIAVNRAINAIINCLRTLGCIGRGDFKNEYDGLLREQSKKLPKVCRLTMTHSILEGDEFVMMLGYKNFQKVEKGEVVAKDRNGLIRILKNGYILMPLYQSKGEEGFCLVQPVDI